MSNALNLVQGAAGQPRPQIIYATVSNNQPLPATFDDLLYVVEPHAPTVYHIISGFPAIHGNTLPTAGADVVLIRDNYRKLWCIWWSGSHS